MEIHLRLSHQQGFWAWVQWKFFSWNNQQKHPEIPKRLSLTWFPINSNKRNLSSCPRAQKMSPIQLIISRTISNYQVQIALILYHLEIHKLFISYPFKKKSCTLVKESVFFPNINHIKKFFYTFPLFDFEFTLSKMIFSNCVLSIFRIFQYSRKCFF